MASPSWATDAELCRERHYIIVRIHSPVANEDEKSFSKYKYVCVNDVLDGVTHSSPLSSAALSPSCPFSAVFSSVLVPSAAWQVCSQARHVKPRFNLSRFRKEKILYIHCSCRGQNLPDWPAFIRSISPRPSCPVRRSPRRPPWPPCCPPLPARARPHPPAHGDINYTKSRIELSVRPRPLSLPCNPPPPTPPPAAAQAISRRTPHLTILFSHRPPHYTYVTFLKYQASVSSYLLGRGLLLVATGLAVVGDQAVAQLLGRLDPRLVHVGREEHEVDLLHRPFPLLTSITAS